MEFPNKKLVNKFRFSILLAILLLLFIVVPFFEVSFLTDLVISLILLVALAAVIQTKKLFWSSLIFALFSICVSWIAYHSGNVHLAAFAKVIQMVFLSFIAGVILSQVFKADKITRETVAGAVCVYLFMGVIWADVYSILEISQPGSFPAYETIDGEKITDPHLRSAQFTYFSFVTLSTLGYGDITPKTRQARSLATMEAIIGQLFLAILIARLVGQAVASRDEDE